MGRMGRSQAARDSPPASTRGTTPGYSERIHKENRIKKFCCSVCYLPNWIYPATRNLSYSSEIDLVLPNALTDKQSHELSINVVVVFFSVCNLVKMVKVRLILSICSHSGPSTDY